MGHVYILSNEGNSLYDGLYKIGQTSKTPEQRAKVLAKSTLDNFEVIHSKEFENHELAEKIIHLIFAKNRYVKNREYFEIDIEKAKKVFEITHNFIESLQKIDLEKQVNETIKKLIEEKGIDYVF